jgi:hypothetical protein
MAVPRAGARAERAADSALVQTAEVGVEAAAVEREAVELLVVTMAAAAFSAQRAQRSPP